MLEYMLNGSAFMWPIWICSVITLGVVMERWTAMREAEIDTDDLMEDVGAKLSKGDLDGAIAECDQRPGPVAETVAVGLRKYALLDECGRDRAEIETGVNKAMEDHAIHVTEYAERNMPLLATMASGSPLLGMLGTVVGLIEAFKDILAKPNEVSGGISVALYTTAASLCVAVPATLFFNVLNARAGRFLSRVATAGNELMERLMVVHAEGVHPQSSQVEDETSEEAEEEAPAPAPAPAARPAAAVRPAAPAPARPTARPPQPPR